MLEYWNSELKLLNENKVNVVFHCIYIFFQENSSEGANTEVKLDAVNGTTETPTA